jgi:UPF0755 protein
MRKLLVAIVILVLLIAGVSWTAYQRVTTPYRGFTAEEVFVELPPGSGVRTIANRLADAGVVPDALSFRLAARLAGADRRLQAGEYRFAESASPQQVVARIARGDIYTRTVTFPEGLTIREMGRVFEQAGLGPASAFEEAAKNTGLAASFDPDVPSLEGYLFPDTYPFPRTVDATVVVKAMAARFGAAFDATLRADADRLGLTLREATTLASLVEKETAVPSERPLVAAVFHNRLKIGMPLQCDPTVIYALMRANRWNGNLRRDDLQFDSPYNTYRYRGLPPGPIASPGRASLEAVVRPAEVSYLYFVSRNDGSHVFATTLAEHNRNVQEWQIRYFRGRSK